MKPAALAKSYLTTKSTKVTKEPSSLNLAFVFFVAFVVLFSEWK
jgi:hypothetical protein